MSGDKTVGEVRVRVTGFSKRKVVSMWQTLVILIALI